VAIDLSKFRNWARLSSNEDDPAIQSAWEAAKRELEERTGWCVDPVTRTQYVASEPTNDQLLVRLERQPVTAVTYLDDDGATGSATLVTINGIQYATMADSLAYPVVLTVTAGTNTLNPLLEMAILQRVTQHVASRGDDTVALPSDYWDRVSSMMGKGIG
jgi:sensor c-di-GMP phosphodiesterase-like protein